MDNYDDDESSDDDEEEEDEPMPDQKMFRYKLLEGLSADQSAQLFSVRKWGLENVCKTYDIIDIIEKKLIEVKFSKNAERRIQEYLEDPSTSNHTALIVINPDTAKVNSINKRDEMPGLHATTWILRRKTEMKNLNLVNDIMDEEADITKYIFMNEEINGFLDQFKEHYTKQSMKMVDMKNVKEVSNTLTPMKSETLFSLLTKEHLTGDFEDILWTGKILPPVWKNFTNCSEMDETIIDDFLEHSDKEVTL